MIDMLSATNIISEMKQNRTQEIYVQEAVIVL